MHSLIVITFNIVYAPLVTILCTVFMYMYTFNNNKTYIYNHCALLFYIHGLHVLIHHPRPPSTKCMSLQQNGTRQSVPATKWLATKCPCDEMAMKCPRDEMAGD